MTDGSMCNGVSDITAQLQLQQGASMQLTRPLLAAKTTDADLQKLKFPMLLSPKIDGIRALVVGGKLMSRSMKLIPNAHTQALFGRPELEGLDGELVVGNPWDKNLMQQTTSGVMSHGGTPTVSYYVFDKWDHNSKFFCRLAQLRNAGDVVKVPHHFVYNLADLLEWEMIYLAQGYEGVMLRDPNGPYKQNRSTLREGILLKVKRFQDSEAVVLDYELLNRNLNEQTKDERGYSKRSTSQDGKVADDLIGSLLVRDLHTGVVFSIGSGFSESQRYQLFNSRDSLRGQIVKYKSFSIGVKEKPRFPIFLGFRSPLDM